MRKVEITELRSVNGGDLVDTLNNLWTTIESFIDSWKPVDGVEGEYEYAGFLRFNKTDWAIKLNLFGSVFQIFSLRDIFSPTTQE